MRSYQLATAAAFVAVAAVAMFDSRKYALIDTSGRSPGGIGAGFYPFWAAAVMGLAGLVVIYRAIRIEPSRPGVFNGREGVAAVLKLVCPMLAATAAIVWLGFYLVTGLYMGFFARFVGRYGWAWVALIAVAFPTAIYLVFELGFRVRLPKSMFYELGLPF